MSLAATLGWTAVRTLVLCLIAWPVCRLLARAFPQLSPNRRPWFLAALLAPYCFPELLVGYAFRDLAMASPAWAEALCAGLLIPRIVPVGTIALLLAPRPGVDAGAIHCRRLLLRSPAGGRRHWIELARCYWHGPIMQSLPALALISIAAFQEFELAALLQTMSWTDWFVTAERLGLRRGEMLRQSLLPLLWQAPVLVAVIVWLRAESRRRGNAGRDLVNVDDPASLSVRRYGIACVALLLVAGCLIPLGLIGWRTVDGLALLMRQRQQQLGLAWEIATSGVIALCAGASAWVISGRLSGVTVALLLAGLLGSLLLSLGCVALFQLAWLRRLYDTPLPWGLALTVWLLPRAAILRLWLSALRNNESIHLARIVGQGGARGRSRATRLLWHLRDQPAFLAVSLLCYWAYCDLPTAYLLAPSGMASGLVRLYNFMHYGRSAALSAEALVFFGVPLVGLLLLLIANRRFR